MEKANETVSFFPEVFKKGSATTSYPTPTTIQKGAHVLQQYLTAEYNLLFSHI